ncbi:CLUMA_CG002155, isoform A [Clunio marinus]|uniref:CLUMA_CG002155, isoform A n=1 Tax=Clunio marinus TaxID=568069 RepID=A0A1J1HLG0_9DIPT|nr:CLUMA_CG002155, isoform A [Clunio marinus]
MLLSSKLQANSQNDMNWESLAHIIITNFYGRGGKRRGNRFRIMNFERDLYNFVPFALNCFLNMSIEFENPDRWNNEEQVLAENADKDYFYYDHEEYEVIAAIIKSCRGDKMNYINVLPVIYKHDGNLNFTPLFSVRKNIEDESMFVDAKGRTYNNFKDWEDNNGLPYPCDYMFPSNGILNGWSVTKRFKEKDSNIEKFLHSLPSQGFNGTSFTTLSPINGSYDHVDDFKSFNNELSELRKSFEFFQVSGEYLDKNIQKDDEIILKQFMPSVKSLLDSDDTQTVNKEDVKNLINATTFFENPTTIQDIVKLIKFYKKSSVGCLKVSILLGFFMNTNFFFYNASKLQFIAELFNISKLINDDINFRITNNKEIVIGSLLIPLDLLNEVDCDELVKLTSSLIKLHSDDEDGDQKHFHILKNISKFFENNKEFLRVMMTEHKILSGKKHVYDTSQHDEVNNASYEASADIPDLIVYKNSERKMMINYDNHDYEIPKNFINVDDSSEWKHIIKILRKNVLVFNELESLIYSDKLDSIKPGVIFHFTTNVEKFESLAAKKSRKSRLEVFPTLVATYNLLLQLCIPFYMKICPWGRPIFVIGYETKVYLDDLFYILSTQTSSLRVFREICNIQRDVSYELERIMWEMNNAQVCFKWLENLPQNSLKHLLELHEDVFSREYKHMVKLIITNTSEDSNGPILLTSGFYGLIVSLHVLLALDKEERLTILRNFEHLGDLDLLMNAIGLMTVAMRNITIHEPAWIE